MRTNQRFGHRSTRLLLMVGVVSLGLAAASCSKKDDNASTGTTASTAATASTATTAGSGTSTGSGSGVSTSEAATTTSSTTPAEKPTPGGSIVVSGEAEVANPWTPAAMQCDSYCQQRARTFFDPLVALGTDLQPHGVLAESMTPNADFSVWTIKLRSGIKFTDGTDMNADAAIRNLQETGSGLLVSGALVDIAKVDDPTGAKNADGTAKKVLKLDKIDDLTFTITTGKGGDVTKPLPWSGLPTTLTGQWGLMASPKWLDAVKADPTQATKPVGTGPFIVQSYAPRDALVVTKNPNYWQKDKDGVQLPYLDKITFKVIEDSQTTQQALESGNIDIFSTSSAQVIENMRNEKDKFPMSEQSQFTETNYLLIDLAKPGPTSDARVRCALSKSIDRKEIIDLTAGGILKAANGLFSPGQEGYLDDNGFSTAQDVDGAKALIDEYKKATGATSVDVTYGHTADRIGDQTADLLKGYWQAIGVNTKIDIVPQDQFITNALFGVPTFFIYGWRNHAGTSIDSQNFWWNSASGTTDGPLSLNFGRLNDPTVDADLATARSAPDAAARKAAAEGVNRTMAKNCDQIPVSWTLWGTPHKPNIMGLGQSQLPDGGTIRDGAGFSGQFWMTNMWVKQG
ncbi:MAG: ABC transporter substrate-binding protein [Ilumatobacteraceae bacterium]